MTQLHADDIRVIGAGDAGITLSAKCPNCGDRLKVAELQWWDEVCSCGNRWYLVLNIMADVNVDTADEETQ